MTSESTPANLSPSDFEPAERLCEQARHTPINRAAVGALATRLPADDDALDALLARAVASGQAQTVDALMLATVVAGRRLEARHLVEAAELFNTPFILGKVAMHAEGNVAAALAAAMATGHLGDERQAMAALVAGLWCRRHPQQEIPDELRRQLRHAARDCSLFGFEVMMGLHDAALLIGDPAVKEILALPDDDNWESGLSPIGKAFETLALDDSQKFWTLLPLDSYSKRFIPAGRRPAQASQRTGRNDPCPCGSGRKYKKCCLDKDSANDSDASDLPGVTCTQIMENLELFLDAERLQILRSHELARLDPARVEAGLRPLLIDRLLAYDELAAAVAVLPLLPADSRRTKEWEDCLDAAIYLRRSDLLHQLVAMPVANQEALRPALASFDVCYLLGSAEQRHLLDGLEKEVVATLGANPALLAHLADSLGDVGLPGLAILTARAALVEDNFGSLTSLCLRVIEHARDQLLLSPRDPIEDIDELSGFEDAPRDAGPEGWHSELGKAREQVAGKEAELRQMRQALQEAREKLRHEERVARRHEARRLAPHAAPPAADPDPELRQRINQLKSALNAVHSEKHDLLAELREARRAAEVTKTARLAPPPPASEEGDTEDDLLPFADHAGQPVRLPVFSAAFRKALAKLPQEVAGPALRLVGQLAAGDPAAFQGVCFLKQTHEQFRARVGRSHRLLFKLQAEEIEFLNLIHRRDLERTLKG